MLGHGRAADRDGDVPVQRRGGLDRAVGASGRRARGRACLTPSGGARGDLGTRRRDRRPARRGGLCCLLRSRRGGCGSGRNRATSRPSADAGAYRAPHGRGRADRRRVPGPRRAPRRADLRGGVQRAGAPLGTDALLVADRCVKDLGAYLLEGISEPEHLFQLLDDELGGDFVPLRVPPAVRVRKRRPARSGEARTLEQLAWATRARLPATPPEERAAISRLATSVVNASRCQTTAVRFCASVDRRALERRLTAYGAMSFTRTRANEAARTVERQLALLDAIEGICQSLDRAARLPTPDTAEIDQAARALEAAVGEARAAIGYHGCPDPPNAAARDPTARCRVPRPHL